MANLHMAKRRIPGGDLVECEYKNPGEIFRTGENTNPELFIYGTEAIL